MNGRRNTTRRDELHPAWSSRRRIVAVRVIFEPPPLAERPFPGRAERRSGEARVRSLFAISVHTPEIDYD
ncbi:hypothetical protein Cni_G15116 [Canna indica]|uniref:Uncharacterized protein n=1 Tax=Canna indica TaxID=4628 RepID=A0AAQ3KDG8_9LILI|nr:hypothetical protein Cni_G15116 [Canna indica]